VAAFLANIFKTLVLVFSLPIDYMTVALTSEFLMTATFFKLFLKKKGFLSGSFRFDYAKNLLLSSWKMIFSGLPITFQARVEYLFIDPLSMKYKFKQAYSRKNF